ncbi:hypothetical protein [Pseudomonas sp. RIT623]|uniref:hypothetical protein n=1 Tax=Pseudomonas sp. RIT623 TaxID=2559075 RepID=UPI00106FC860|nr:hypothetical protein [Pseudomonas sp. RIT623]TFF41698.1 hypothetical protein E3U47_08085 [Pseudomonas sp. RIT623]
MTALSNSNSAVEVVSFQAYELQQVIDGNDMASEKRYLQVLIETKDTKGRLVTLSAEQLSHLEWIDVKSGKVLSRCERVEIDLGDKRAVDNAPQQSLVTFLFEENYKTAITLKACLELDGALHDTNEVALGAPKAAMGIDKSQIRGPHWLPGLTTVPSNTPFTISLKRGKNEISYSEGLSEWIYNSQVSVFNLSLSSKKKIRSVTTIPSGDNLFHVGSSLEGSRVWSHCWWFHSFAPVREFDYVKLKGDVGGEHLTFSYIGGFYSSGVQPTGPEKFYFVTIDESYNRHETVLVVTNETYVFRNSTPSESKYYSGLIKRKGSA